MLVLPVFVLHRLPFLVWRGATRFASARFWLIITNVDRKIASSETIIVSSPNGYASTPRPIQEREPHDVEVDELHRAAERGYCGRRRGSRCSPCECVRARSAPGSRAVCRARSGPLPPIDLACRAVRCHVQMLRGLTASRIRERADPLRETRGSPSVRVRRAVRTRRSRATASGAGRRSSGDRCPCCAGASSTSTCPPSSTSSLPLLFLRHRSQRLEE